MNKVKIRLATEEEMSSLNKLQTVSETTYEKNYKEEQIMDEDTGGKALTEALAAVTVGVTTTVKRKQGRPTLAVGTVVTRKNGTFVKGEDGKFYKTKA